jgi:hypothetical protein
VELEEQQFSPTAARGGKLPLVKYQINEVHGVQINYLRFKDFLV